MSCLNRVWIVLALNYVETFSHWVSGDDPIRKVKKCL